MGRRLSERCRTLAPSASARLPRLLTCRQRMEDKAATSGEADRPTASESPVGENDRTTDDHGARSSEQGRYRHHRCHRGACTNARRRAHSHRKVPDHGPPEGCCRTRTMDRVRRREPGRVFCQRNPQRQSRSLCRYHRALVERPDRGPDHQAQAGETPMYGRAKIDPLQARLIGAA